MLGDYENFLDMINGGGAGRAGQRFEGGGLLSAIANSVARPYGYEDRLLQARPQMRPTSLGAAPPPRPTPGPTPITPMMRNEDLAMSMPVAPAPAPMGSGMTPANNYVGPPAPPQMGSGMTPANAYVPMGRLSFEQFVAGLGPVAQTASPMALRQAYDQFLMGY